MKRFMIAVLGMVSWAQLAHADALVVDITVDAKKVVTIHGPASWKDGDTFTVNCPKTCDALAVSQAGHIAKKAGEPVATPVKLDRVSAANGSPMTFEYQGKKLEIPVADSQPAAAAANLVKINLSVADGGKTLTLPAPPPTFKAGDRLEISCPGDCNNLSITQGATTLKKSGDASPSPWTSPAMASAETVTIGLGTDKSVAIGGKASVEPQKPSTPPTTTVSPVCPSSLDRNEIAVDTTGNVLATNLDSFTDNDTLTVWVQGPDTIVDAIRVVRLSAFRDVTVLRIQGDPGVVTGVRREGTEVTLKCKRTFLSSFTAGRGEFALLNADGTTLSKFEFAVRPVWDGMFTVAFVTTWLPDRSFSLRDGAIVQDPSGKTEGRFALMYTAFVPPSWTSKLGGAGSLVNRYLGGSVGVLLDHPTKNLLFGANIGPFNGLSFVFGGHYGKVTELDGVKVGQLLGADATIPTTTAWHTDWFVGISLDISVATKLFFSGFSTH